jgi:hypothetical protein
VVEGTTSRSRVSYDIRYDMGSNSSKNLLFSNIVSTKGSKADQK